MDSIIDEKVGERVREGENTKGEIWGSILQLNFGKTHGRPHDEEQKIKFELTLIVMIN